MAIAASLLLQLRADVDRLKTDLAKGKGHVDSFTRDAEKSGGRFAEVFKKIGLRAEDVKKGLGGIAAGALAASGAFDNAGKVGKAFESTLGAFLVGGPIAAGFVGLGNLVKLLGEDTEKAGEAAKKASEEHRKWLTATTDSTIKLREETARLRDELDSVLTGLPVEHFTNARALRDLDAQIAKVKKEIAGFDVFDGFKKRPDFIGEGPWRALISQNAQLVSDLVALEAKRAEMVTKARVEAEVEAAKRHKKEMEQIGESAAKAEIEGYKGSAAWEELDAWWKQILEERKRTLDAEAEKHKAQLDALSYDMTRVSGGLEGPLGLSAAGRMAANSPKYVDYAAPITDPVLLGKVEAAGEKAGEVFAEGFTSTMSQEVRQMDPIFMELGQTVASAFADGIASMLFDKSARIEDIFRDLFQNLTRQALNATFSAGLNLLFGAIGGGGGGFSVGSVLAPLAGAVLGGGGGSIGGGGGCEGGT